MKNQIITVYVAVGSNLQDRRQNIQRAVEQLAKTPGISALRTSSLLENPAVGGPPESPLFLNGALELQTTRSALALLERLLGIEHQLGRVRRDRWEPRPIDLDILFYGDAVMQTPMLTIPHPRLHQRYFVLKPLAELAPHFVHPLLHRTISELLAEI